jgi:hypothetical protein
MFTDQAGWRFTTSWRHYYSLKAGEHTRRFCTSSEIKKLPTEQEQVSPIKPPQAATLGVGQHGMQGISQFACCY